MLSHLPTGEQIDHRALSLICEVAVDSMARLESVSGDWPAFAARAVQLRHVAAHPCCDESVEDLQWWVNEELHREVHCTTGAWDLDVLNATWSEVDVLSVLPDALFTGKHSSLPAQAWDFAHTARRHGVLRPAHRLAWLIAARTPSIWDDEAVNWFTTCWASEERLTSHPAGCVRTDGLDTMSV